MRPIRTFAILPTMFTLGNLVCGFFAIVIASRVPTPTKSPEGIVQTLASDPTNCMYSAWLIFLAMVFDALDGYIARLAKSASEFGAELDSLCDMVSFGVAPAFLLVKMCPEFSYVFRKEAAWVIAASFAVCASLRLARFNVETSDEDDHLSFHGLPSPAAAASVAGFAIMFHTLRSLYSAATVAKEDNSLLLQFARHIDKGLQFVLPFFALLAAMLMVSRIPYPHVVNQLFRGQRPLRYLVGIIFSVVALMVFPDYAVSIVCVIFVLYPPLRYVWEKVVQRRHQEESIF
jgi:CDP-diacylglycerol--serine O-phosphatidyltransferase